MTRPFEYDRESDTEIAALAERLFETIDPDAAPSESYRHLFEEAIAATIESRRELAAANKRIARLETLNITDEITGALNRRGFNAALDHALARVRRTGESGVLLIIDLDGFKQINDLHGHQAGDMILASVAKTLKRHTRETDTVARLGGDEFAVLLTNTEEGLAGEKIQKIEELLNSIAVPWDGKVIRVRASVGAVPYGAEDMADILIGSADRQMYEAKRATCDPAGDSRAQAENPVERTREFGRLLGTLPTAAEAEEQPMQPHPERHRDKEKQYRIGGGR